MTILERPKVVVVGAGISGLAAAQRLTELSGHLDNPPEVLVLDASPVAGGVIKTLLQNDSILETGPEAFTTSKPSVINLCSQLGISNRVIPTNKNNRITFVAYRGRLHPLPEGFVMLAPTKAWPFVCSGLFSLRGKLRMAMDLFLASRQSNEDESLAHFVVRRFGMEALERVAQPMIGGIQSAAPETLSMRAALPNLVELEQRYGSVIRGLITEQFRLGQQNHRNNEPKEGGARYSMLASFDHGLSVLVNALVKSLPSGSLHTNHSVTAIRSGRHGHRFDVLISSGQTISADAVILAIPAHEAARLLLDIDPALTDNLHHIEYCSTVIVTRLYHRSDIPQPINGFGFVVPRTELRNITACTFSNIKFQNRAPDEKLLLRIFVGGELKPETIELSNASIEKMVSEDLRTYLGINTRPVLSLVTRHYKRTPQYQVGHQGLVTKINNRLLYQPGLALAGNAYIGAGIPDCITSGQNAAASIISTLAMEKGLLFSNSV